MSPTVQESEPAPVMLAAEHESDASMATPVPDKATVAGPVEELLAIDSWPANTPADAGAKWTGSVALCPGLMVSGNAAPVTWNPAPATVAEVTVTAADPVDVKVKLCDVLDPTGTFPKFRLGPATSVATYGFN